MIYYLGTSSPGWLWTKQDNIPLFVSAVRLRRYKNLYPATSIWALDSGGYSELHKYGEWTVPPDVYAEKVRSYYQNIGKMQFAAVQDWMCEDSVLKKTGKTVYQHQELTIKNYDHMVRFHNDLPWLPVLQGRAPRDYIKHLKEYKDKYPDLTYFGIGSVCRRGSTQEIIDIIHEIFDDYGVSLHGFGIKTTALKRIGNVLKSADSSAWSFAARYNQETFLKTCEHKRCNHCYPYAKNWYRKQRRKI